MNRRGLLRLLGLAPIAAVGQAVGIPAARSAGPGHLAGTLSALEPMEIGFIRGTMANAVTFDELHISADDPRMPWSPPRHGWGAPLNEETITMADDQTFPVQELRRIAPRPGERIALLFKERLTVEQHNRIQDHWRKFWQPEGAPPLLILDGGAEPITIARDGAPRAEVEGAAV